MAAAAAAVVGAGKRPKETGALHETTMSRKRLNSRLLALLVYLRPSSRLLLRTLAADLTINFCSSAHTHLAAAAADQQAVILCVFVRAGNAEKDQVGC